MSRPPHVRGAFPWLRSGPIYRMDTTHGSDLDAFLAEHDYTRLDLDGTAVTDRDAAHLLLRDLLGFPDWYGHNWDAFHDSFGGFVHDHDGGRFALVWHDLDVSARQAPVTTTELGWALLDGAFGHRWPEDGRASVWLDVFALGSGPDFDRSVGETEAD